MATSNQVQIIFNYRNQFIGLGQAYQTPMISLIYPWLKQRRIRKAAFGLSALQDKTGDGGLMTTTGGLASIAYNFALSPLTLSDAGSAHHYHPYISVGVQGGYYQRNLNFGALTSGNQWDGSQFLDYLPIGEPIEVLNPTQTFSVVHAGALFYLANSCGDAKAYLGVNVQNLNQPQNQIFDRASAIPLYYIVNGGMNFDLSPFFTVQPNGRWIQEKNSREIRAGVLAYYNIFGGNSFFGEGKVGAGLWYDSNQALAVGIEVHQPKYFIGFSYDMGASSPIKTLGSGAWEISLGIKLGRKCLNVPQTDTPKELVQDTLQVKVPVDQGDSIYTLVHTLEDRKIIHTDTIAFAFQAYVSEDGLLIPTDKDMELLKRIAFFYYISDDINQSTALLLDEVVVFLQKFQGVKLEIIGHACNIGKTEDHNLELSLRRSKSVKNYLIKKGIAENRLMERGLGSTQPILSNSTEYGRIKNRRVEFKVLSLGNEKD
ncbi:MAG: PorP/SprF family type IX secretion system membrane protein [Bacteroidia bacterium]|nr:PorP/SprF family type IX secretion system membrane protein [Bacteroidia bacterium]